MVLELTKQNKKGQSDKQTHVLSSVASFVILTAHEIISALSCTLVTIFNIFFIKKIQPADLKLNNNLYQIEVFYFMLQNVG